MKFNVLPSYEDISTYAAELVKQVVEEKNDAILGLATGSSPIGLYKELIKLNKEGEIDFKNVITVNLDEYIGLAGDHHQSYRYFMNDNLFNHVNIDKKNTYVPDGVAKDLNESAKKYEELVKSLGTIDVQILGIGANGHIGFNEPADELVLSTHVTDLTAETIKANARFFETEKDVPTEAITMGLGLIMQAKKIILIASGENKAEAIKALSDDMISTRIPATLLKFHPDVTILLDKEAASLL